MKNKLIQFINLWAGLAALWLALTEVPFPWSLIALLLGYVFAIFSSIAYRNALFPTDRILSGGPIIYLANILTNIALAAIPLFLVVALPGTPPFAFLTLATIYGFARTLIEPRLP